MGFSISALPDTRSHIGLTLVQRVRLLLFHEIRWISVDQKTIEIKDSRPAQPDRQIADGQGTQGSGSCHCSKQENADRHASLRYLLKGSRDCNTCPATPAGPSFPLPPDQSRKRFFSPSEIAQAIWQLAIFNMASGAHRIFSNAARTDWFLAHFYNPFADIYFLYPTDGLAISMRLGKTFREAAMASL